jgi:hypothetical protein
MLHVAGVEVAGEVGEALARRGLVGEQVLEQAEAVEVVLALEAVVQRVERVAIERAGDLVGELVEVAGLQRLVRNRGADEVEKPSRSG